MGRQFTVGVWVGGVLLHFHAYLVSMDDGDILIYSGHSFLG